MITLDLNEFDEYCLKFHKGTVIHDSLQYLSTLNFKYKLNLDIQYNQVSFNQDTFLPVSYFKDYVAFDKDDGVVIGGVFYTTASYLRTKQIDLTPYFKIFNTNNLLADGKNVIDFSFINTQETSFYSFPINMTVRSVTVKLKSKFDWKSIYKYYKYDKSILKIIKELYFLGYNNYVLYYYIYENTVKILDVAFENKSSTPFLNEIDRLSILLPSCFNRFTIKENFSGLSKEEFYRFISNNFKKDTYVLVKNPHLTFTIRPCDVC